MKNNYRFTNPILEIDRGNNFYFKVDNHILNNQLIELALTQ